METKRGYTEDKSEYNRDKSGYYWANVGKGDIIRQYQDISRCNRTKVDLIETELLHSR